jgi:ATP-dependent Clp protease ATP-binding subunit ClpA
MFERFTEKAVNAVSEAQRFAKELKSLEIYPEHLLLALVSEAKGVSLKLFRMSNLTLEALLGEVNSYLETSSKELEVIPFSLNVKDILKRTLDLASKSGNQNILFEHLFLSTFNLDVNIRIMI